MTLTDPTNDPAFEAYQKDMKRKPVAFVRVINEKNYPEVRVAGNNYSVGGFKATYAEAKADADQEVKMMEAAIDSGIQNYLDEQAWPVAEA